LHVPDYPALRASGIIVSYGPGDTLTFPEDADADNRVLIPEVREGVEYNNTTWRCKLLISRATMSLPSLYYISRLIDHQLHSVYLWERASEGMLKQLDIELTDASNVMNMT